MQSPESPQATSAAEEQKSVDSLATESEALAAIDRAENELAMLFPGQIGLATQQPAYAQPPGQPVTKEEQGVSPSPSPSTAATRPAPEPSPSPPKKKSPSVELSAADRDDGPSESACALACRALGSMQRATERLCELSGAESERCEGAKSRVEAAIARVTPVCSDCGS